MNQTIAERRKVEEKQDNLKLLRWGLSALLGVLFVGIMLKTGIKVWENEHRTHYMYSDCEDDNIRRKATCDKRWAVYPDDHQVRQYKDSHGDWRVVGTFEKVD